ncbi:MAG: ABC transporter permease subunit, partial [Cyanobacteria bacterium J06632_22]
MTSNSSRKASGITAILRDDRFWKVAFQVIVLGSVILAFLYLGGNLNRNLSARGTGFGFGFIGNPAGFGIGETLIDYQAQDPYGKVIQVGLANSLRAMLIGIILALVVGISAGVASFSDNWLVYKISRAYVGLVRNVPLLLQLFFWYLAVFFSLPLDAITLPNSSLSWFVLSKRRGIYLPGPEFGGTIWIGLILLVLALLLVGLFFRSVNVVRQGVDTKKLGSILNFVVSLLLIPIILVAEFFLLFNSNDAGPLFFKGALPSLFSSAQGLWIVVLIVSLLPLVLLFRWRTQIIVEQGGTGQTQLIAISAIFLINIAIILFAFGWQTPTVTDNGGVTGGLRMSLEYGALVTGLVFYTGAFIAEIVRAGIQSVSKGQWEAARSLGLGTNKAMQLVVFPQAMRVIIPPLNSEFANLAKNTS